MGAVFPWHLTGGQIRPHPGTIGFPLAKLTHQTLSNGYRYMVDTGEVIRYLIYIKMKVSINCMSVLCHH